MPGISVPSGGASLNNGAGIPPSDALVVSSAAALAIRTAATESHSYYGALVNVVDGTGDDVEINAAIGA